jgi:hypothetical protein
MTELTGSYLPEELKKGTKSIGQDSWFLARLKTKNHLSN